MLAEAVSPVFRGVITSLKTLFASRHDAAFPSLFIGPGGGGGMLCLYNILDVQAPAKGRHNRLKAIN